MIRRIALVLIAASGVSRAEPHLVALAPGGDDARQAVAIGAAGEVYEPDGKGSWVHRLPTTTATPLEAAGRAGDAVVAIGDGVVYRLAGNGWSAIRLVQHGKAVLGAGAPGHAVAAVGRQVFALDQLTRGEPTKLIQAPAAVIAIAASGKAIVIATDAATYRAELGGKAGKLTALPPGARHARLISDRWAISDRGALELPAVKLTKWPTGLTIGPATAGADDALVAIGSSRAGLELVTVRAGKLPEREPITGVAAGAVAVGVVVDRQGRAVVALADGRLAVRSKAGWTTTDVRDELPAEHPGAGPATQ